MQRLKFRYPTTIALLLLYFVAFALTVRVQGRIYWSWRVLDIMGIRSAVLIPLGALDSRRVLTEGNYWRLATATMLHASLAHLLMNSLALWQLGRFIEEWYGGSVLLVLHVGTGIGANIASVCYHASQPFIQVGSSGALFAMLGFVAIAALHGRKPWHRRLWWSAVVCLGFGLALGAFIPADNAAHLGGAVLGIFCGMVEFLWRPDILPRFIARSVAVLAVTTLLFCFLLQWSATGKQIRQNQRSVRRVQALQASKRTQDLFGQMVEWQRQTEMEPLRRKMLANSLEQLQPRLAEPGLLQLSRAAVGLLRSSNNVARKEQVRRWVVLYRRWVALVQRSRRVPDAGKTGSGKREPASINR